MRRGLEWLFLATLLVLTWDKIRWETGVASLTLSNIGAAVFVVAFALDRIRRRDLTLPAPALTLAGFGLAFFAVFLVGYFNLQNHASLVFWLKGLGTWGVHFLFLVFGVALLTRAGRPLFLRGFRWFVAGIALNCVYGVLQLVLQVGAGINLDEAVVGPLTQGQGGVGGINVFGKIGGEQNIYRVNALTGDPNHLGVILCIPLLTLLPVWLARGRPLRLGLMLAGLFAVQVLTLSRSGALGDTVGLVLLLPVVWRYLPPLRQIVAVLGAVAAAALVLYASSPFVQRVIEVRTSLGGSGTQTHFRFYELVPPALDPNPLFGMGFNTFAVFYEFVTGREDFGPHSIWIAILVETGLVGLGLYLAYFAYLVTTAAALRLADDPVAALLGRGLVAALIGTAVANLFYLTMQFDYFFAVALFTVAGTALFAPRTAPADAVPAPA